MIVICSEESSWFMKYMDMEEDRMFARNITTKNI